MRLSPLVTSMLLSAAAVSAGRSLKHAGNSKRFEDLERAAKNVRTTGEHAYSQFTERQDAGPKFLTAKTKSKSQEPSLLAGEQLTYQHQQSSR